jgi:DNA polymerase-3 subunit chi
MTKSCVFHDTDSSLQERRIFEIVEKAYIQRAKVVIFAPNQARATAIDRILWINKQESFIPHKIVSQSDPDPSVPIVIVTSEMNPIGAGILVAGGHCSLEFATGFDIIHEFVDRSSADMHQACRERFRAYRDRQVTVEYQK